MTLVALIQARMNSRRLPGKVLMPLGRKLVLEHVVDRVSRIEGLDDIVVATSIEKEDNPVYRWCQENNVKCFRGSLNDVLDRFVQASRSFAANAILRITADCPLLDSEIASTVVNNFSIGEYDLYSLGGKFPDGLDCSVFACEALEKAWRESTLKSEREHVGPYIEKNPDLFKIGSYKAFDQKGIEDNRWTLDEECDYILLNNIVGSLQHKEYFNSKEILALLSVHPEWVKLNSHISRNEGYNLSIMNEANG